MSSVMIYRRIILIIKNVSWEHNYKTGYLNPVKLAEGNLFLIAFTAQLGSITLTLRLSQPLHQLTSCRYAMKRYSLRKYIKLLWQYSDVWHVAVCLLMNILLFRITIVVSVAVVCCLQDPHVQANGLEAFVVSDTTNFTCTLFFL